MLSAHWPFVCAPVAVVRSAPPAFLWGTFTLLFNSIFYGPIVHGTT